MKLPNLTNVNQMFSGCYRLQSIDLSWQGLRAKVSDFSQIQMFDGVPQDAVLEIGSDTSENTQDVMAVTAAKFPGNVTVNVQITDIELDNLFEPEQEPDVPELPQEPEQEPDVPELPQEPEQEPDVPELLQEPEQQPDVPELPQES